MSHPGKPNSGSGFTGLTDQLRDKLSCDINKPDFRELDLGSPISPLRTGTNAVTSTTTTTTTSSSSSSSGSVSGRYRQIPLLKRSESGNRSHSGELSGSSENSPTTRTRTSLKSGHTRSDSGTNHPLKYSGQSTVNSPPVALAPTGNICPSGKILKTAIPTTRTTRSDVLGTGTGHYGHGSIMRGSGGVARTTGVESPKASTVRGNAGNYTGGGGGGVDMWVKRGMESVDSEEVKRAGNELYKRGHFSEAVNLYGRAIKLSPENPAYRSNRAAALTGLGRLGEAVKDCEKALKLDPNYGRAHQRLASLFIRLGQVENARKHLYIPGHQPDPIELQKLQAVEKHISKCADARRISDWKSSLRECNSAIAAGADFSPQIFMCRAESYLKLQQLDEVESAMSNVPKVESIVNSSSSQTRCFGMLGDTYIYFVQAQVEMAFGRFENAVTAIEQAGRIDPRNVEVAQFLHNVRLVAGARARGNDLFNMGRYTEACSAYGEGLLLDPKNQVLFCNRAACWFKIGMCERSIQDCDEALRIQPSYTKALLRRAASNSKLEKWEEAVRDYEVLRKELPDDYEVAESLFHAQVALKKSRGEDVSNMKFGGEVEEISSLEQFRAVISLPGTSVIYFMAAADMQCKHISPFFDTLCGRYPSLSFLKVDINERPAVASADNVRIVPTFKIYKNGVRVKEIVCPSRDVLEHSVRHYNLLSI